MRAVFAGGRRQVAALSRRRRVPTGALCAAIRHATTAKPTESALTTSTKKLRDSFHSREAVAEIVGEADAPVNRPAVLARMGKELSASEDSVDVSILGEVLTQEGRKHITVTAPIGPNGGAGERKVSMTLPSKDDMAKLLAKRREDNVTMVKPEDAASILEKYLTEKFVGRSSDHVALLAAWGPKAVGDAEGEFAEVAALMSLQLRAFQAGLASSKEDWQFEINRVGYGKECLVMPPSNFALLGLKDTFHMLLQGYRVLLVVQPRFLPHFLEVQSDLAECGLPEGMLEVVPGITPDADPEVIHEALKSVDRLQFTGSSVMFRNLVTKAYELGNLRLEHAGEVSGVNKVRLDGVSATHPAAAAGSAWAAMANNGELCTSASLVEFDPATGDTASSVKTALEGHAFRLGTDPMDADINVLLKEGKTDRFNVKTEIPADGFREWWEKEVLASPRGSAPHLRTNQSLGHCIYSPTIERAVQEGVKEDASCVYMVGVPEDKSAPSARAGTTGCKLPESAFGGMKTHTFAVAGDHDGVGSVQTILNTVKRRGNSWRDREEAFAEYELTETAEDLLEFLNPADQKEFQKTIFSVLDVFAAFEPEVSNAYPGQPLVGGEGSSQLVTLRALRPVRKNLFIPRGVGLPEDVVKVALLSEMSPLKEIPIDIHLVGAKQNGKLRVVDPLKSFLRVVEKRLGWKIHWHDGHDSVIKFVDEAEYPPYFYCVKDRHVLPVELLTSVVKQGGYVYEGIPSDALSLFRWLTATQAWTVSCTEGQTADAQKLLAATWKEVGLREESHERPSITVPAKSADVGGGFGNFGAGLDDKDWADLSDDGSSSDDEPEPAKSAGAGNAPGGSTAGAVGGS